MLILTNADGLTVDLRHDKGNNDKAGTLYLAQGSHGFILDLSNAQALRLGAALMFAADDRTYAVPDVVASLSLNGTAHLALELAPADDGVRYGVELLDPASVTVRA